MGLSRMGRWPMGRRMGAEANALDWKGLMRLGLGALRLSPEVFWAMTPAELMLALEGAGILPIGGRAPMGAARLAELMAAFPDAAPGAGKGDGGGAGGSG